MIVIIMLTGVTLSFVMGVMFTGLVVKPIRGAFDLLKSIAKGDLTQEISSSLIVAVDGKAKSLATVGSELSTTLLHNRQNVQDLAHASEQGRTHLQDVSKDIEEVAQESAKLLEVNAIIKRIASQTNLLSMNAAIEAANLGTAVLGFAVVAEDIDTRANTVVS